MCCIWNTKVETDALSQFNSTAMLTHDLGQMILLNHTTHFGCKSVAKRAGGGS